MLANQRAEEITLAVTEELLESHRHLLDIRIIVFRPSDGRITFDRHAGATPDLTCRPAVHAERDEEGELGQVAVVGAELRLPHIDIDADDVHVMQYFAQPRVLERRVEHAADVAALRAELDDRRAAEGDSAIGFGFEADFEVVREPFGFVELDDERSAGIDRRRRRSHSNDRPARGIVLVGGNARRRHGGRCAEGDENSLGVSDHITAPELNVPIPV